MSGTNMRDEKGAWEGVKKEREGEVGWKGERRGRGWMERGGEGRGGEREGEMGWRRVEIDEKSGKNIEVER